MKSAEDIGKLHSESLQLRGQQFQIVTLALASTGISAWLIPAISSGGDITVAAVVIATGSWLFLLYILFAWSLSLKRLIDVIGSYLKKNELSDWEGNFNRFHKESKIHTGQTKFSFFIFMAYGFIVTLSGVYAIEKNELKVILIALGLIYWLVCLWKYRRNSKQELIDAAWDKVLGIQKKLND